MEFNPIDIDIIKEVEKDPTLRMRQSNIPPVVPIEKGNNRVEKQEIRGLVALSKGLARALAICAVGIPLISACAPKISQTSTSESAPITGTFDPDLLSRTPTATKEPTPKPTSTPTKEPTPIPTVRPVPLAFSYDEESIYREDENVPLLAIYVANMGEEDQKVVARHHEGSSSLQNYTSGYRIDMRLGDLKYVSSQTGINTEVTEEELIYMQQILLEFAPYKEFYYYRGEDDFMCIFPQGLSGVYFVEPNGHVTIVRTFAELLKMGFSEEIMDQVYDENYIFLEKDGEYMPVCRHLIDIRDSVDDE